MELPKCQSSGRNQYRTSGCNSGSSVYDLASLLTAIFICKLYDNFQTGLRGAVVLRYQLVQLVRVAVAVAVAVAFVFVVLLSCLGSVVLLARYYKCTRFRWLPKIQRVVRLYVVVTTTEDNTRERTCLCILTWVSVCVNVYVCMRVCYASACVSV